MSSLLESLRRWSVIVADTGDLGSIERFAPRDATTNPSLILQAAGDERYRAIVDGVIIRCATDKGILDELYVEFGRRILGIIPGRVSTEVDARWSFNSEQTVAHARRLVELYDRAGIGCERVLIKIASTWEGIASAAQLERDGIHCNLTLLFSFAQAVACADAGVSLISPFVGRIYDWHLRARGVADIAREADPGVESVRRIYHYYKKFRYPTQIMGASFRKATQIIDLAGCDLLTISPALLAELAAQTGTVSPCLDAIDAAKRPLERMALDEGEFRWRHNQDAMATDKLADGIRRFDADARRLEALITARRAMFASGTGM